MHHRGLLLRVAVSPVLLILFAAAPTLAKAQQDSLTALVQGVLLEEESRASLSQGVVRLMTADGQTVLTVQCETDGRFSLRTPGPGTYYLQGNRIGYRTKDSGEFSLPPGHVLSVEIHLSQAPIPGDSLQVIGQRRPLRATEQLIQGRLRDLESGDPIPYGTVYLLKASDLVGDQFQVEGQVLSDSQGMFTLITPLPGTYRLRGERIGYRTTDSPNIHMMPGDTILLDLLLSVEAIVLDPIRVRASAQPWGNRYQLLGMDAFFHRQSRFGNSGFGTFLTRNNLARFDGRVTTGHMLLTSAMAVRYINDEGGVVLLHECNPSYYLNGAEIVRGDPVHEPMLAVDPVTPLSQGINLQLMYAPENLEAVEVYVSPTIPAEFSSGFPCGVIGLWTRRW